MKTNILANAAIGTSMALLLLVAGISIASAKDLQSNQGAANISNHPPTERVIDAISGKEDTGRAITSDKVLYEYKKKYSGWDRTYKYGDEKVGSNPQPVPPKDTKAPPKKDLGEAVGLNPQPLPPKDMGAPLQ